MNPAISSTEFLVELPRHVYIDEDEIDVLVGKFAAKELQLPRWDEDNYPASDSVDSKAFFILENSMNFAFNDFNTQEKFTTNYKGVNWRGSQGYVACLTRALEQGMPLLSPSYLRGITRKDCEKIFQGNIEIPLLNQRKVIMNELGTVLSSRYDGFEDLVSAKDIFNGKDGLVERLLNDFPSFRDIGVIDGKPAVFAKRAQLAAMQIVGKYQDNPPWPQEQINMLTLPADYVLPRAMRDLRILKYSKNLARKVDNGVPLEPYSREEAEIRAAVIHVGAYLQHELRATGKNVAAPQLDYALWSEGRAAPQETRSKEHLCRTIAY